jgi:acyl carrier protein
MTITHDELKSCLIKEFNLERVEIREDTPLFSSNLLDSFSMVDLVRIVEEMTGSRIRPTDLTLENFDSISRILVFVSRC